MCEHYNTKLEENNFQRTDQAEKPYENLKMKRDK
jgi:hypothetical protein